MSASQTEESFEILTHPWNDGIRATTTITTNSIGTPIEPEHVSVDERSENGGELESTAYKAQAADAALEQRHLTKRLQNLAQEVKRMRLQAAHERPFDDTQMLPTNWTAKELRLVQWAIDRWCRLKSFSMAEEILKVAVHLREANVIASVLIKEVVVDRAESR